MASQPPMQISTEDLMRETMTDGGLRGLVNPAIGDGNEYYEVAKAMNSVRNVLNEVSPPQQVETNPTLTDSVSRSVTTALTTSKNILAHPSELLSPRVLAPSLYKTLTGLVQANNQQSNGSAFGALIFAVGHFIFASMFWLFIPCGIAPINLARKAWTFMAQEAVDIIDKDHKPGGPRQGQALDVLEGLTKFWYWTMQTWSGLCFLWLPRKYMIGPIEEEVSPMLELVGPPPYYYYFLLVKALAAVIACVVFCCTMG